MITQFSACHEVGSSVESLSLLSLAEACVKSPVKHTILPAAQSVLICQILVLAGTFEPLLFYNIPNLLFVPHSPQHLLRNTHSFVQFCACNLVLKLIIFSIPFSHL